VLDHYTLIVEDAAAVARFHEEVLGFKPLRIQEVNAGSAPDGEYDMLNHVMQIPGTSKRVMVITEGLTDDSIFRRYMRENGPGVHHVAYEVDDLDHCLSVLHEHDIKTTSDQVLKDPLTGLRQEFIDRVHSGYFVELIERTEQASEGVFTNQNMAALARTMIQYLQEDDSAQPLSAENPQVTIQRSLQEVVDFMAAPQNMARWTGHRSIRLVDGRWLEIRAVGDIAFSVETKPLGDDGARVSYQWQDGEGSLTVEMQARQLDTGTAVSALLPPLEPARLQRTRNIIQTELELLAALLEDRAGSIARSSMDLIDQFHLEVYQRKKL
jgi:methylmalonyl-CoA/ethylmalonyl-CoA epimerase